METVYGYHTPSLMAYTDSYEVAAILKIFVTRVLEQCERLEQANAHEPADKSASWELP